MPDPKEVKDALEGLERLYEAGKGGARMLKDVLKAIKTRESPTFTVKEGLKFKRAWYRALRMAESYIQGGKLVHFKELVTTSPCRHQLMFQWGICQLLGRFAADTQWDIEPRRDAMAFLGPLFKTDNAKVLLEEMRRQNTASNQIANSYSQPWNNIKPSNPAELNTSRVTLLNTVQNRNLRYAKMENMMDPLPQPRLEDIQSALKTYYAPELIILRVSGDSLDLETCFINLAIVEAPAQREREKQVLKEQAVVFHRNPSFERLEHTDTQSTIPLEQLFDKRKLRDGKEDHPKKILVQGRAGIGKTTLCKKLLHAHHAGLWGGRFDMVLWLPLRQLRAFKTRTLEGLFREKFFAQGLEHEGVALSRALAVSAQQGRVLFILDGLDEIVFDTECDEGIALRAFLKTLLTQQHVVITSRPSGLDRSLLPPIDLELETIGFSQENVSDFLAKVLAPKAVKTVQDFIQRTPLIQGLVNIPVQLDVICFSWDSLPKDGPPITMTGLYRLMVRKLWCKDALRLKKTTGGMVLTARQINQLAPKDIDELMATELQHLGYLAFKGMQNNHQIEFEENDLLSACGDLMQLATERNRLLPPQLLEVMKQTSFLHTADADLDSSLGHSRQAWYFLHLTFQEYFAATWLVQHLQVKQTHSSAKMMTMEQAAVFVQKHKYNPQYEIVWWMVAGLLEGEALNNFFCLLQGAPRDLIGARHQQILASCLHEARARLDLEVVATLDSELMRWLQFELRICWEVDMLSCHERINHSKSMLGSQPSLPEALLLETLDSQHSWKPNIIETLEARPTISDEAIHTLHSELKNGKNEVKYLAASALGKQSNLPESVIQSLFSACMEDDEDVQCFAEGALSRQSTLTESSIQFFNAALRDKVEHVRITAAKALGMRPQLPESAIQSLIAALKDEHRDVRDAAATALGNQSILPESALQSIIAALDNKDAFTRYSAASVLGMRTVLPGSAIHSLVAALKDEEKDVRSITAAALGNQTTLPDSVFEALVAALEDHDEEVRAAAATALGKHIMLPESAISSLITALEDENGDVRYSAASALGNQSTMPESAIPSLCAALQDEESSVRSSAVSALGKLSTLPGSLVPSLVAALQDEYFEVRSSAAAALGNHSTLPESAIQSLVVALTDEDDYIRSTAAESLGKQCTLPEFVIKALVTALQDQGEDGYSRSSAAAALGSHPMLPESAIQSLMVALVHENEDVRSSAAASLGNQSALPQSAIQSLMAALNDQDEKVRSSAVSALRKQTTLPAATLAALDDENELRLLAASAMIEQPALSDSAFESLMDALWDDDWSTWVSAEMLLRKQTQLGESAIESLLEAIEHGGEQL
ncbi:hypothetical protein BGZ72_008558 [Mortierella alpina]|nr:hypothetical protein BGZ72_008558 [Mortierella alpina]